MMKLRLIGWRGFLPTVNYYKKHRNYLFRTSVFLVIVLLIYFFVKIYNTYYVNGEQKEQNVRLLNSHTKKDKDEESRENAVKAKINTSVKNIVIPAGMQSVTTFQHTSNVGTADNPTIDGGIINAADGIPVNHYVIETKVSKAVTPAQSKTVSDNHISSPESEKISFEDNWATSDEVKRLLTEAVQQGRLNYVLKKTDEMKLPASVAVVPMVESRYQTNAISPKGAAGAWQLMPMTAKDYGITAEERFNFNSSTDSALKLLNDLHSQFGNWALAFAAYNAGSKRVQEALNKNPQAKSIDELDLPVETKHYVKKLMNLNKTFTNMEKENV